MKVLERGKKVWPITISCFICCAVLEVDKADVVMDRQDRDFWIKCPECNISLCVTNTVKDFMLVP
jgi:hypothetical protein